MRGASRAAFIQAREQLASLVSGPQVAATLGGELFAVTGLLDREPALRRALTDATSPPGARTGLVRGLLGGRVSRQALDLLAGMASARWGQPRDLADATEQLAVFATAASAEGEQLDDVEDELFRFARIASGERELYAALSSQQAPGEGRRELAERLLEGKVHPASLRLITQVVVHPRGRSLEANLAEYARLVAEWRDRLIAVVRVAVELTDGQRDRLGAALSAIYGHDIQLNIVTDPGVIGGMSVQIGDEYIDGTLSSVLARLRRQMAA